MATVAGNTVFNMLATFCSVPFKNPVSANALQEAFSTGVVSKEVSPYIDRAINEMPIEMLGLVVSAFENPLRAKVIANISMIARQFGATKRIESWMSCG